MGAFARKIIKTKEQIELIGTKLLATMFIQFIISMIILGFAVNYINKQTDAAILRNDEKIQKIIKKSKGLK